MKIMPCPVNGPRNITEFVYGGPVVDVEGGNSGDDEAWSEALFAPHGPPGVVREWWCHGPTGTWFIAERNTLTDEILCTYAAPRRGSAARAGGPR